MPWVIVPWGIVAILLAVLIGQQSVLSDTKDSLRGVSAELENYRHRTELLTDAMIERDRQARDLSAKIDLMRLDLEEIKANDIASKEWADSPIPAPVFELMRRNQPSWVHPH